MPNKTSKKQTKLSINSHIDRATKRPLCTGSADVTPANKRIPYSIVEAQVLYLLTRTVVAR